MEKIYLHCDMNNYFASVEIISDPSLKDIPMVVSGDPSTRHGIVLARNYLAKDYGIMTGESIYSALKKLPALKIIKANYSKYVYYAKQSRQIYAQYSKEIIPYGLDEAWLILYLDSYEQAINIANEIRERFKKELQLTISIGVSFNYIFSKLASDMKKPDATTVLKREDMRMLIWPKPAFELLYVGKATRNKLRSMGILTIGDLANTDINILKRKFGKVGVTLYQFANGDDSAFSPLSPEKIPFKNISNTITIPKDITDEIDILGMIYVLTYVVTSRLKKHELVTKCLGLNFKYYNFEIVNRHLTLEVPTDNEKEINHNLNYLFKKNYKVNTPIRSIGVSLSNLDKKSDYQLTMLDINHQEDYNIKEVIQYLKSKFGDFNVEKVSTNSEKLININDLLKEDK